MRLLIDGYNLLHVTDLFGEGNEAGTLQGARQALLTFLAGRLSASQRRATTIVFDAAAAPPGLPDRLHYEHLTVCFARGYPDADAMIEELLEQHRAPRGVLVVSSDHRVQRAARHCGAKRMDSEQWYRQIVRRTALRGVEPLPPPPAGEAKDNAYWIQQFSVVPHPEEASAAEAATAPSASTFPPSRTVSPSVQPTSPASEENRRRGEETGGVENPFPPGYAEDLLSGDHLLSENDKKQ